MLRNWTLTILTICFSASAFALEVPSCFNGDQEHEVVEGDYIIGFAAESMSGQEVFEALGEFSRGSRHLRIESVFSFNAVILNTVGATPISAAKEKVLEFLKQYVAKHDAHVKYIECNGIAVAF